ncbi:hypothetical protein [Sphingomonas sp.]|uniref:hypothetical protein n=1 Tax=Sphingomonas sp. TaxID=28214 RepID=UPI001820CA09|nr:hypothetical protein [Sphingomonas sp.]MBA4763374.1 hypothetical protein [Sphingomonas sp.]
MRNVRLLILLLAVVCGFATPTLARPVKATTEVVLTRDGDGDWLLEYRFARAAPAWFFVRSANALDGKPWRPQSWRVETPGVRLERIGHHDVLTGDGTPLKTVRIRVRPYSDPVQADYQPVLAFSDGGVGVYTDHHLAAPLSTIAAARDLPADLNGVAFDQVPTQFTLRDPGKTLLFNGRRHRGSVRLMLDQHQSYVYSGPARALATPAFVGIIDPGLPVWARDELNRFTPRLFDYYTARLGRPAGTRPTLLASWGGTTLPGVSLGGSVLDGMVVMNLEGAAMVDPQPALLAQTRWFIGHEGAHFWMGQTVRTARRSAAWMTEGAADVMAVRALAHFYPDYDARGRLQKSIDDCIAINGSKPLSGAFERGAHRANYACGAVLMMAAEGAARKRDPRADLFTWLRTLIDPNRKAGVVTPDHWLTVFAASGGAGAEQVRSFLDRGIPDPAAFIAELLEANGVAVRRDGARVILT